MSKHNRQKREKQARNLVYAKLHRQLRCSNCGHQTSLPGACPMCMEKINRNDYAKVLKEL